jgi:hypothetical protein
VSKETKEKRKTVPLERLHLQPGWCLVLVDKEDARLGRVVGFPQGPKGKFKLADADCLIDLDEDSIELDLDTFDPARESTKGLPVGRYAIVPVAKVVAFIAPEAKDAPDAPRLVVVSS